MKIFSFSLVLFIVNYYLFIQNMYSLCDRVSYASKNVVDENVNQSEKLTQNIDLTEYLPSGYVKDGSIDYSKYIQKGIDENTDVLMPNFPILINEEGIKAKSNSRIVFQEKSILIMKPNSLPYYSVIKVFDVNNVVIQSPKIIGDRNHHKGNEGEWGMGVHIRGSKNIEILSLSVSDCWGDGLYIGGDEANTCDNITIINAKIDSCRRNGISITDGQNIQILNPIISNTRGTSPMAGIDIEPNNNKATIDKIVISNLISLYNGGFGILIALGELPSDVSKSVKIKINNHIDRNSKIAFCIAAFRGDYKDKTPLIGLIEINNPKWYKNKETLIVEKYDLGPKTKFKNIKIFNDESETINKPSKKDLMKLKKEQKINKNIFITNSLCN